MYKRQELDLFYGSVSEIINGLGNNKLDFGFIIENSNDILKDEYCSLSLQIKQRYTAEADKKKNAFDLDRLINRRRRPGPDEMCDHCFV